MMHLLLPPLPILHIGGTEPTGGWYSHWLLDPRIVGYLFVVTGLYLAWVGPLNRRRPGADQRPVARQDVTLFCLGTVTALIALGPPMDDWSHWFLASAHMAQHLILLFVTVPLWIAGIPAWVYRPIVQNRIAFTIARIMTKPVVAYLGSSLILVAWHFPRLYGAALDIDIVHTLQHQFFILAGFWLWWPLMSKVPELPRLSPPVQCLYLFLQTLPGGAVGAFITYSEDILYDHYIDAGHRLFGLSLRVDQEISGLTMWVGSNTLFLVLISIIFLRWANREEDADRRRLAARRAEAARIVATSRGAAESSPP